MKNSQDNATSRWQGVLYVVLLLSGVSALIYQIVWIRKFGLVFGVDVYTMGTVLSAFMGGLALGSYLFGRLADRTHNPLRLFLLLELGIGLFALLFPLTFNALIHMYTPVIQNPGISSSSEQFIKFAFSFLYLLIPTTLMGGTLPVIFKFFIRELKNLGWKISNLYALNNLGAVIGCLLAGFLLIRYFGLHITLYFGAFLNLINAALIYRISRKTSLFSPLKDKTAEKNSTPKESNKISISLLRIILWVFVIEGFATLAYEVLWTRIFVGFSYDKTTYLTTVIIVGFVFGLSLGSFMVSKWIDRMKNLVTLLAITEIMIGLTSFALMILFAKHALALNLNRTMFESWSNSIGKEYLLFFMILLIPTTLTGFVYPIVGKLYADNIHHLGKRMGNIGFMDTAGSIAGSFAAGFLMIPALGVIKSFIAIVILNTALGILIVLFNKQMKTKFKIVIILGTGIIITLIFMRVPDTQYFSWWDRSKANIWSENFIQNIPFYDEGPDATVMIREYSNHYALNINGHSTAYTTVKDQIANRMLGYIPYMLHPDPKRAMVIGFGLGFTVESLIQPEIITVDVAEISKGVVKSGHRLNSWNGNVIDHPKVKMHLADGRGFLSGTHEKFDIITSNAIHPRLSNNIYTRDFYLLCKQRLQYGGIMCQWATPNWMTEMEYKAQVRAFAEVFDFCQLWYLNEYSTILIGSDTPIVIDYGLISERFKNPKVTDDLKNIFMIEPYIFTSQFSMEKEELIQYCRDSKVNTDDHPVVEFSTVVNIAPDTSALKFFSYSEADFGRIKFSDTLTVLEKNEIIKNMQKYAHARKLVTKDIIGEVRRQINEYEQKMAE